MDVGHGRHLVHRSCTKVHCHERTICVLHHIPPTIIHGVAFNFDHLSLRASKVLSGREHTARLRLIVCTVL